MVSVLLDLSGEPLFKRGYRTKGGIAPLRETTAAAIILLSGWKRKFPLFDPFCGAGTVAIEAAMYAWDIAPGLGRHFALERLLLGDRETERKVRKEFSDRVDFSRLVRIWGSDSDAAAVDAARSNLERAMGSFRPEGVGFRVLPMEEAKQPEPEGFIITNPPYGRRLGDEESAEKTYAEMGKLAGNFKEWKLALITDNSGFESFFGRKADSCREITNGAIRSYLYQYEKL
jgi:putative N6-adenine-specific DNA methylase